MVPTHVMPINFSQYHSFWKKARENTTCYPHSLSFSTMKAGALDDYISEAECKITNIPLATGFAPSQWKKCLDVMITKKSGVTALSGVRTIVHFQVDCNYTFQHIGHEMMKRAERRGALAPEQYGRQKRQSYHSCCQ
jgi:hypothetical protein